MDADWASFVTREEVAKPLVPDRDPAFQSSLENMPEEGVVNEAPNNLRHISIPSVGFDEIENAGKIRLTQELRIKIEDVLNSYIVRSGWDRNSRPSKETKAHVQSIHKHVRSLLQALDDVSQKFSDGIDFRPGVALQTQCLLHRAGIHPVRLIETLSSIDKVLEEAKAEHDKGGRPKDFFLPQFFCELEEIYFKAGGRRTGVTKTLDDTRESPFADFVNAILRFAPAEVGPSSSPAVAVAWERQRRSRRASTTGGS